MDDNMKKSFLKNIKNENGFTLIEFSMVALIAGIFIAGAVFIYSQYRNHIFNLETMENVEMSTTEISTFFGRRGRYPIPANPTLGPGDIGLSGEEYGEAVDLIAAGITFPLTPADCPNVEALGIKCVTNGAHDVNGNSVEDEVVLIGTIPIKTLADESTNKSEFRQYHGFDGNKNKLTYAVTAEMTNFSYSIDNPANPSNGAIVLWDEDGNPIVDPSHPLVTDTGQFAAQFLVLSGGKNGRGVYTVEGEMVGDCKISSGPMVGTDPVPGFAGGGTIDTEIENCDGNDAIFVSALKNDSATDFYYDDIVRPAIMNNQVIWRSAISSTYGNAVYNANSGQVAVGNSNEDASAMLEVTPNIGQAAIGAESRIQAEGGFCGTTISGDENDCLDPEFLGGNLGSPGDNDRCPAGEIVKSIENNTVTCEPFFTNAISFDCAPETTNTVTYPVGVPYTGALQSWDLNGNYVNDQKFARGFKVKKTGGVISLESVTCETLTL